MKKAFFVTYSIISYLIGFAGLSYMIGFLAGDFVPFHIDNGVVGSVGLAIAINVVLVAAFGLQHSVMARPTFKKYWTRVVPKPIERSTFVLFSGLTLFAVYVLWRPMPDVVWHVEGAVASAVIWAIYGFGWFFLLSSTFVIDHFDLMGLKQPFKTEDAKPVFITRLYYKIVRHPIMTGFVIAIWATPHMTLGHFLFSIAMTTYILIAIQFEERNLIEEFGEKYREYIRTVPMLVPFTKGRTGTTKQPVAVTR